MCTRARSRPPRTVCSTPWSEQVQAPRPKKLSARNCAPANSTTRRSTSRSKPAVALCPCSIFPVCPARKRGAGLSGVFSAKRRATPHKPRRVTVADSYDILINEESDKLLDTEQLTQEAIKVVENNGIVFLDEIDKICARDGRIGADVS